MKSVMAGNFLSQWIQVEPIWAIAVERSFFQVIGILSYMACMWTWK